MLFILPEPPEALGSHPRLPLAKGPATGCITTSQRHPQGLGSITLCPFCSFLSCLGTLWPSCSTCRKQAGLEQASLLRNPALLQTQHRSPPSSLGRAGCNKESEIEIKYNNHNASSYLEQGKSEPHTYYTLLRALLNTTRVILCFSEASCTSLEL